jgi:hypothetical protein
MRTLLLAAFSLLLLSVNGLASIVYSGIQDIPIPANTVGVYLDFKDGADATPSGVSTFNVEPSGSTAWDINLFFGGEGIGNSDTAQVVTASTATNATVLNLSAPTTVSSSSVYPVSFSGSTAHVGEGSDQFMSGTRGYIGMRIDATTFESNAGTGYYYGWMQVTLNDTGSIGAIHDWAWDDSGAAITVGAVPEVSTVGGCAFMFLGALLSRRRRPRHG